MPLDVAAISRVSEARNEGSIPSGAMHRQKMRSYDSGSPSDSKPENIGSIPVLLINPIPGG
ncbi:MAG: hypothetical protein ACFFCS_12715 [Candidatus Hodarchaeota archaeon]